MNINLKNRQQLLVIAAAGIIGLFILNKILITPIQNLWTARSARVADLRKKVDHGQRLISAEKALKLRWAQMQASTLTNDVTQAEQQVHRAFTRWSSASGVQIVSLVFSPWKTDSSGEYMTQDSRVEASGDIRSVKTFLQQIEQDPMALKEQTVEVSSKDANGRQIVVGLQLSALVLTPKKAKL
jgi:hypothetical protein